MKRTLSIIALVAFCSVMMISCKNKKTAPSQEDVNKQKLELADSVLAIVDSICVRYQEICNQSNFFDFIKLTDEQKLVKPDYLLDLSLAETFLTREQKMNALAIYATEVLVRQLYEMPTEEANEVIGKLVVELNRPLDVSFLSNDMKTSEKIAGQYKAYKEIGETDWFWKFQFATATETQYIVSKAPDVFLAGLDEESNRACYMQWKYIYEALRSLAPYDEEMNYIIEKWKALYDNMSYDEVYACFATAEKTKETYKSGKFNFEGMRNALLQ